MYILLRLQLDKLKSDFSFLAICTQCRERLDEINESIEGQSAAEAAVPIMNSPEATELDEVRTRFILHFQVVKFLEHENSYLSIPRENLKNNVQISGNHTCISSSGYSTD